MNKANKILLIDADSVIPNIPLMKLSKYHKDLGHEVTLIKLSLPYYPNKKKIAKKIPTGYDKYYCSIVFSGNYEYIDAAGNDVNFGGTGYSIDIKLPDNIEKYELDYSLYPDCDYSLGFITRGCIRNCSFCLVPKKEGYIKKVSSVSDIVKHKKVKFLDNNILAYDDHLEIFDEIIIKKLKISFNQGFDIRLVNEANSEKLSKLRYWGDYIFAFDDYSSLNVIERKLELLSWRKDWAFKFYMYYNPNMEIENLIKRVKWAKKEKVLPYVMRDITCWGSKYNKLVVDLAAYCNQPSFFKSMSFEQFLIKRHPKDKNRAIKHAAIFSEKEII